MPPKKKYNTGRRGGNYLHIDVEGNVPETQEDRDQAAGSKAVEATGDRYMRIAETTQTKPIVYSPDQKRRNAEWEKNRSVNKTAGDRSYTPKPMPFIPGMVHGDTQKPWTKQEWDTYEKNRINKQIEREKKGR